MAAPMSPGHSRSPPSSASNPFTSFPVLAIAISGILATAVLLLGYYVFVIKCCLYWRRRGRSHDYLSPLGRNAELRGLEPSLVGSLPVFRYSRPAYDGGGAEDNVSSSFYSHGYCAVCLIEFLEEERLKLLPGCFHAFHIDCIDAWLQCNANCPLCRSLITSTLTPALTDQIHVPASGGEPQMGEVIEVRDECRSWQRSPADAASAINPSPKKKKKRRRKYDNVGSKGDECIDLRTEKAEQFCVQPMRRSLSMNSSSDRQLYLSVQDIFKHKRQHSLQGDDVAERGEGSSSGDTGGGGGGGGGKGSRTCCSLGRSSWSPVLQVHMNA